MGHSVPRSDKSFVCLITLAVDDSFSFGQYECFKEEREKPLIGGGGGLRCKETQFSPNLGDAMDDAIG